jgi:secreted trypsin-like serine protease
LYYNHILFILICNLLDSTPVFDYEANIIGGIDVDINEFPYQASIRVRGLHICGGTIISMKHILTAAHCVSTISPPYSHLKIVTGTSSLNYGGEYHNIRRIDIYPEYNDNDSYVNDISIVTVNIKRNFKKVYYFALPILVYRKKYKVLKLIFGNF